MREIPSSVRCRRSPWIVGVFTCVIALTVCRAGFGGSEDETARVLELGKVVFGRHCAECHGYSGDGYGERHDTSYARPRSFLSARFKLATTENGVPSDADLRRTIERGMPGSGMPNWGWLSEEEIDALVQYVRSLGIEGLKDALDGDVSSGRLTTAMADEILARRTVPGPPIVIPPEAETSTQSHRRGRRIYVEGCAGCHGTDGTAPWGQVKTDFEGNWLPSTSLAKGIFKGGAEGDQLYARILKGMNGTAMPSFEGLYTEDEMWDLIHYVQSLSRQEDDDGGPAREPRRALGDAVPGEAPREGVAETASEPSSGSSDRAEPGGGRSGRGWNVLGIIAIASVVVLAALLLVSWLTALAR